MKTAPGLFIYNLNLTKLVFFVIITTFICSCNTGIKIADNCGKLEKIKIVVLPFKNDDYLCNTNIENMLRGKCYEVENGKLLIAECSIALKKTEYELSIAELVKFAANREIDMIIYGNINYEWIDGSYTKPGVNLETDKLIEGNYAVLDGYCIDIKNNQTNKVISNYRVKKVLLGMPNIMYTTPSF